MATGRGSRLAAAGLAALAACSAGERQAPVVSEPVLAKPAAESGDRQIGVAGQPLARDLRAVVLRDGQPVKGVTVYWTTLQGLMTPATAVSDAEGISAARWTTKFVYVEQEAFASLEPVTEPRVVGSILPGMLMYTAIAAPDPEAATTVTVPGAGGDRFEPASIAITVGDTVNWFWPEGSGLHNVVPDDGNAPATSGAPTGHPKFLSYRFVVPGAYRYHCAMHGAPGGVGMSGTVTVLPRAPTD